jgi:hypothetical protein
MVRRRQGLIRRLLGAGLAIILIAYAPASRPAAQARLGGRPPPGRQAARDRPTPLDRPAAAGPRARDLRLAQRRRRPATDPVALARTLGMTAKTVLGMSANRCEIEFFLIGPDTMLFGLNTAFPPSPAAVRLAQFNGGRRVWKSVACWKAYPARSSAGSARRQPTSCTPTGRPPAVKPPGRLMVGTPARLNGVV